MSVALLLADLDRRGIRLEPHGDRLRYHPRSAVTPELVERLRSHKAELLAMLSDAGAGSSQFPEPVDDLADDWTAGIPWNKPGKGPSGHEAGMIWPYWIRPAETTGGDGRHAPVGATERPLPGRRPQRVRRDRARTIDVPIHGSRSIRTDCARCGRFLAFTRWYGQPMAGPVRPCCRCDPPSGTAAGLHAGTTTLRRDGGGTT